VKGKGLDAVGPEALAEPDLAIELANWLPEAGPDLLEEAARSASWAGDPKQAATVATHLAERWCSIAPPCPLSSSARKNPPATGGATPHGPQRN
jgi:hypothetical protein